jgi:hypothetical protein
VFRSRNVQEFSLANVPFSFMFTSNPLVVSVNVEITFPHIDTIHILLNSTTVSLTLEIYAKRTRELPSELKNDSVKLRRIFLNTYGHDFEYHLSENQCNQSIIIVLNSLLIVLPERAP